MKKIMMLYLVIIIELCVIGGLAFSDMTREKGNPIEMVSREKVEVNYKNSRQQQRMDSAENELVKGKNDNIELKDRSEIIRTLDQKEAKLSEEEVEIILKEEASSVFKVDCSEIKGDLSFGDKADMVKVATKIDFSLFNEIKDLLYHKNQEYGVLKALILLKDNLNEKDYEIVKKISGRYVDVKKVDKYYDIEQSGVYYQ